MSQSINTIIDENKEFYFITYAWKHPSPAVPWQIENTVIDEFPATWMINREIKDKDVSYRLLFYKEINQERFNKLDGWI